MLSTYSTFEFAFSTRNLPALAQVELAETVRSQFVTATDLAGMVSLSPRQHTLVTNGGKAVTNGSSRHRYSSANLIDYVPLASPASLVAAKTLQIDLTAIPPAAIDTTSPYTISGSPTFPQLMYDLRQLNPTALISVRVASNDGVGAVAVTAAKNGANIVYLSALGDDKALPWYVALTQIQQALCQNQVRGGVQLCIEVPWQSGTDVVTAAILGADSFSVTNKVDQERLTLEVCEVLNRLGFTNLLEITGRTELLTAFPIDLAGLFTKPADPLTSTRFITPLPHHMNKLNKLLLTQAHTSLKTGEPLHLSLPISRANITAGATLSGAIITIHNGQNLPDGTFNITFHGSAGPSFGAFNASGLQLTLVGNAADLAGLGMGGGHLILRATMKSQLEANRNLIAGNGVLAGATGGWCFVAGQAGDGFAMHNQGATAVVEGVGNYGCAMMSGGTVINLGETGSNFGAGMRGGVAYMLDRDGLLPQRILSDSVCLAPMSQQTEIKFLHLLITRHLRFTGSALAQTILDHWDENVTLFQQVLPRVASLNGR